MTIIWKETRGSKWAVSLHYKAQDYFPPYEAWLRRGHRKARAAHVGQLSNGGELDGLCRELRTYGVAQRPLGYFSAPYEAMVAAADRLCAELAAQPVRASTSVTCPTTSACSPARAVPLRAVGAAARFRRSVYGLASGLLRSVGVAGDRQRRARRHAKLSQRPGGRECPQDHHLPQRRRCRDRAVPVPQRAGFRQVGRARGTELTDRPPSNWVTCLGPRLTANVCDTARCLHRASPPYTDRARSRSLVSERPYLLWPDTSPGITGPRALGLAAQRSADHSTRAKAYT